MTSTMLTLESRDLVLALHAFLNDLEPARYRDEREPYLLQRVAELRARLSALLDAYATQADSTKDAVVAHFHDILDLLDEHPPEPTRFPRLDESRQGWMELREHASHAYEALVASLEPHAVIVPSLRPTNYVRNLFHILAAVVAVAVVYLVPALTGSFLPVVVIAATLALIGWSMETARRISPSANAFLMRVFSYVSHPHETYRVNSSTWYVTALALLSLTFEPMICAVSLAILGLADPAAAIVGKRFGHHRFPNGRSLEGTATFVAVGMLTSVVILSLFHEGVWSWPGALLVSIAAALASGLTELFSQRIDDNLSIPIASAVAMLLAMWILL